MALQRQLANEEWDLVSIITDPVLFGEFMRNTSDGAMNRKEWPKGPKFKYRWYQKDLLTDKNEYICLTAGRAVGKCQPGNSRVYTYPYGYVMIQDLLRDKKFLPTVYAIDENKRLVQRRMYIQSNGKKIVYKLKTSSGHHILCTDNHPILTPTGYKMLMDLDIDEDQVAISTYLPHESRQNFFSWEELRYLGYVAGKDEIMSEGAHDLKYQAQVIELQRISEYFDTRFIRNRDGSYILLRKRGPTRHASKILFERLGMKGVMDDGLYRVPMPLKAERLENIIVFLESYFSQWAEIDSSSITVNHRHAYFAYDIQELLLRFGIQSKVSQTGVRYKLEITDYDSYYEFFQNFDLPGITVRNLKLPSEFKDPANYLKYDFIESIEEIGARTTYAVQVHDTSNYISGNIFVHNSLVLEDKLIFEAVNNYDEFPITREQVLTTSNLNQMSLILDRFIRRFSNSSMVKSYLAKDSINRSKGTFEIRDSSGIYIMHSRIAGSKTENNVVGLHVPRIKIDEAQIYPMGTFTQLLPALNAWEPGIQVFACGVPNGVREGNVLYYMDQKSPQYKKYRIPAHENPNYFLSAERDNLIRYGGEDSEDYQRLVLGRHGTPAFSIIPRDKIKTEPFEFYSGTYNQDHRHAGHSYNDILTRHQLDASKSLVRVLAIDTGYADPTIAQVMGQDKHGVWRTFARYKLTRIPFPEQADIIDWLDDFFQFNLICFDLGAGGGGIGVTQDLLSGRFQKTKRYADRVHGVQFGEFLQNGESDDGSPLKIQAKSFAGSELARLVTEGQVIFSEVDFEGVSQLERVAYERLASGINKYFVLSETGRGKGKDDHIFASYVVFVLTLLTRMFEKPRKKLFSARWMP